MSVESAVEEMLPGANVPMGAPEPGESAPVPDSATDAEALALTVATPATPVLNPEPAQPPPPLPDLEAASTPDPNPPTGPAPGVDEAVRAAEPARVTLPAPELPSGRMAAGLLQLDMEWLCALGVTYGADQEMIKRREYRVICRQLIGGLDRRNEALPNAARRLVAVTSAVPGEGKTYTSFNVARSVAELNDLSVVLVDFDLVRRTLSVVCDAADSAGVAEFLRGDAKDLEPLIRLTSIPRLAFLPAGEANGEGDALMSPVRLERLIGEIAAAARGALVIFDCPPVMASETAAQLSRVVDRVLFVVRAAETLVDMARASVERLEAGDKVVLLLNGWAPTHLDYDYYGQYRGERKPRPPGTSQ